MNLNDHAAKIESAILSVSLRASAYLSFELYLTCCVAQTIAEGKTITGDLGGKSSTKEYTSTIIDKILKA